MKTYKHKLLAFALLFTTILFAQKQDKKVTETFKVNSDAVVEITTRHTDVTIETWNKNVVSVEGIWEVEGMSKEDANELFKNVDFEASSNNGKVEIIAKSDQHNLIFVNGMEDFNFDFDSIAGFGKCI